MDVGQLLATFKPLPESRISPLAATLPERNSWPKKDNLRPIHPPLEASYAVLPFRQVTRDKLSITVTKLDILRFQYKLQIAVLCSYAVRFVPM